MNVCNRPECQTTAGCAYRGPRGEMCWTGGVINSQSAEAELASLRERLASAEQNTLDAYARIQALEGEVARLRDCLRDRPNTLLIAHEDGTTERLSRALADRDCRIAELETALEPFAAIERRHRLDKSDDHLVPVELGHLRRARTALGPSGRGSPGVSYPP